MNETITDYVRFTLEALPDDDTQVVLENILLEIAEDLAIAINHAAYNVGGDVDFDGAVGTFMNAFFMKLHSNESE